MSARSGISEIVCLSLLTCMPDLYNKHALLVSLEKDTNCILESCTTTPRLYFGACFTRFPKILLLWFRCFWNSGYRFHLTGMILIFCLPYLTAVIKISMHVYTANSFNILEKNKTLTVMQTLWNFEWEFFNYLCAYTKLFFAWNTEKDWRESALFKFKVLNLGKTKTCISGALIVFFFF